MGGEDTDGACNARNRCNVLQTVKNMLSPFVDAYRDSDCIKIRARKIQILSVLDAKAVKGANDYDISSILSVQA